VQKANDLPYRVSERRERLPIRMIEQVGFSWFNKYPNLVSLAAEHDGALDDRMREKCALSWARDYLLSIREHDQVVCTTNAATRRLVASLTYKLEPIHPPEAWLTRVRDE
jgi:hypothetical protein